MSTDLPPIQAWVAHVCAELDVPPALVDLRPLLEMTRDVAHEVDRPAAPVTAFIAGLAVASGGDAKVVSARISELAHAWEQEQEEER
ncbi:DUF6457 domain-containing protein [Ruania suaedae]|uniref:DUF6457 domain-containing protein n=1 Tax=Ruania suaedae TaxID=2897774 RepID=UPI001E30874D|nr:DUF6457 domain-containing protein [Ruania suaedae]UFU03558.1 DUF6457 domain-containing protein [Ruania suaedae]